MKRFISFFITIIFVGIVGIWIYILIKDYQTLPANSELLKFTLFQIKALLFALFFIISSVVFFAVSHEKNKSEQVSSETKPDLADFSVSVNKEKAFNVFANLEVMNDLLKKNTTYLNIIREDFAAKEAQTGFDTGGEESLLAGLAAQTALIKTDSVRKLMDELVSSSSMLTSAQRVSLFLANAERTELRLIKGIGWDKNSDEVIISANEGIAGYAFSQNKRLYVTNIETHPELGRKNKAQYKSKSFIIFPVKVFYEENVLGVLNLTDKKDGDGIFSMEDLEKMNILMNTFALKMENMTLKGEMKNR